MIDPALAMSAVLAVSPGSPAATRAALQDRDCVGSLGGFVKDYLRVHSDLEPNGSTKVIVAKTSLGVRDPRAYVIYVTGGWCGSGGCHTLIVSERACRFGPVGFVPATILPISMLPAAGEGDAAITVVVRDTVHGGVEPLALTREVDVYGYHPGLRVDERHPEVLISADAVPVPLD